MSQVGDRLLLDLSVLNALKLAFDPPGDATHANLRALFAAVYAFPTAILHDVRDVVVKSVTLQHPLFPPRLTHGDWTKTSPQHDRTEIHYETQERRQPVWIDIFADLRLTAVLELQPGQVESIVTRQVTGFNTLDEFRERFRFLDIDAFMAERKITTVNELKNRFDVFLTQFNLRAVAPFNADDPATHFPFSLKAAILIRDTLDITAALRDAKLARICAASSMAYLDDVNMAQVKTACAPVVVFPDTALAPPFTADAVRQTFAAEEILALFVTLN